MHFTTSVAAILGMAAFAQAHMEMTNPPPLRSKNNKFSTNVDYEMKSPLSPDGSNFPCRGSIGLVGTEQGKPVADWPAGSKQSFTVDGGAFHNGGSCQASLSYDKGKTWTVIHSYVGNCPSSPGATTYDFTVPADAAAGEAVFAWTWFNQVGNREMYMNCAVVNVQGSKSRKRRGVAMSSRPAMFVANVGNGCGTVEGKDLLFPDPGPESDVTSKGSNTGPPTGKCATGGNPGNGGNGQSSSAAPKPSSSAAPKPSSSAAASSPAASSPAASATQQPSPTLPGGVFATVTLPSSSEAATSSTAAVSTPAVKPTTIQTSIRPSSGSPVATNSTPVATTPVPTGTPGGNGSGSGYAAGAACDELGSWNCIGGNQFQRCGAGNQWSVPQQLAAGTSCQPGVAKDIIMT
ncbi:hypothetical protein PWT90_11127 [Aphanocladium album]|nr:hypothetical protein PWT90_11127 [Aphanocladium album]